MRMPVVACGLLVLSLLSVAGTARAVDLSGTTPAPAGYVAGQSVVIARTAESTTYTNPDGTQTSVMSENPMNYQASDGSWQPISDRLESDPSLSGGYRSVANSWHAHFGSTAEGVSVETAAGTLGILPAGANAVTPVLNTAGDGVTYTDAWPGADLTYRVTSGEVKESVLIKNSAAGSTFSFDMSSGPLSAVLGKAAGHVQGWSGTSNNSLTPAGLLAGRLFVAAPIVLRADGEPMESAHARMTTSGGRLSLSVDPAWLASLPASAFPINLDPTVFPTPDKSMSFKTDGFTCSNCNIQFGNAVDGGNTFWRTVAHFPYESLFGDEILGAQFNTGWQGGTQNAYQMRVFWASSYSYAGAAGHPTVLAIGQPGGSTGTISGTALTAQIKSWADSRISGGAFGFVGTESGQYTYQTYQMNLAITYYPPPSQPTGTGFKAAAPSTPACTGGTIDGTQASSWKTTLSASPARALYGIFQWWDTATPSAIHTASKVGPYNSGTANGWVVGWAPNVFADGHNYAWRVQAYDGIKSGPWSGNCTFHVTDPVSAAPTNVGFGASGPALSCGSTVRGDQPIYLNATIKSPTSSSKVRGVFYVSYTVGSTVYNQTYVAGNYFQTATTGSPVQATIQPNTSPAGTYAIPNNTPFTWSVTAQTQSDGKYSPLTGCSGTTSSGQLPAPQLSSDVLTSDGSGSAVVGENAGVTLTDASVAVTEYIWSYQQTLPSPLPTTCPTAPSNNWDGVGLACSSQGPDDAGNPWNTIQAVPPRTSFSLTVWAVDATGTVSPPTTVNYVVADTGDGAETHLWETDAANPGTSVADVIDPQNQLPLSLSNSGASWLTGDGAPWQNSPNSGGGYLHLNGSTGYAEAPDSGVPLDTANNLWDSSDDFTVQAWVRPTGTSGSTPQVALAQDGANLSGFWVGLQSGNWTFCMPSTQYQSGSYQGDCATIPAGAGYENQWALLTAVWDASAGQMRLYVATGLTADPNYIPTVTSISIPHTVSAQATGAFSVGRGQYNGVNANFWSGDIEDPATYGGVMSPDSVMAIASSGPYNPSVGQ